MGYGASLDPISAIHGYTKQTFRQNYLHPQPTNIKKPSFYKQPVATNPECPLCGSAMVKRTARKGVNAGNEFWGCSAYPGCRGTR